MESCICSDSSCLRHWIYVINYSQTLAEINPLKLLLIGMQGLIIPVQNDKDVTVVPDMGVSFCALSCFGGRIVWHIQCSEIINISTSCMCHASVVIFSFHTKLCFAMQITGSVACTKGLDIRTVTYFSPSTSHSRVQCAAFVHNRRHM